MKKLYTSFYILTFLEVIALVCSHIFGWKSDQAMDKSGIGDAKMCIYWSRLAGYAFWSFLSVWFLSVVLFILTKFKLFNKYSESCSADVKMNKIIKTATLGPLIALPVSWLLYFMIL